MICARDDARRRVLGDRVHERFVDLQHVDHEGLQIGEARIAGAEIVDINRVAGASEGRDRLPGHIGVQETALRRFDPDLRGTQAGSGEPRVDQVQKARRAQILAANVDRHVERRPRTQLLCQILQRLIEHEVGQRLDQAMLLGQCDEDIRRDIASVQIPSGQRFDADAFAGREIHDRLIDDVDGFVGDRPFERGLERHLPRDPFEREPAERGAHRDAER
ncbi:hypothetical protein OKW34_000491 [Paraburkholderia youngii]